MPRRNDSAPSCIRSNHSLPDVGITSLYAVVLDPAVCYSNHGSALFVASYSWNFSSSWDNIRIAEYMPVTETRIRSDSSEVRFLATRIVELLSWITRSHSDIWRRNVHSFATHMEESRSLSLKVQRFFPIAEPVRLSLLLLSSFFHREIAIFPPICKERRERGAPSCSRVLHREIPVRPCRPCQKNTQRHVVTSRMPRGCAADRFRKGETRGREAAGRFTSAILSRRQLSADLLKIYLRWIKRTDRRGSREPRPPPGRTRAGPRLKGIPFYYWKPRHR